MNESIDEILDEALAYVHEGEGDIVRDEIRRLRKCRIALQMVMDEPECLDGRPRTYEEVRAALATTPPEGERELAKNQPCGCVVCTCEDEEQCHGCGANHCGTHPVGQFSDPVYADAPHTPEQAEGEPMGEHEKRRNKRINKLMGDLWDVIENDDPDQPIKSNAAWDLLDRFDKEVRQEATARTEPEQAHGDALADEPMRLVRMAFREGVDAENVETAWEFSDAVVQADVLKERIEALTASGVPYVPEEVRRLPEQWRRNPPRNAQDCAYDLESVLASAPADGWKLVPVEPTQAMVLAYNTCGGTERVTADGPPRNLSTEGYRAMIAAAPSDGGE